MVTRILYDLEKLTAWRSSDKLVGRVCSLPVMKSLLTSSKDLVSFTSPNKASISLSHKEETNLGSFQNDISLYRM